MDGFWKRDNGLNGTCSVCPTEIHENVGSPRNILGSTNFLGDVFLLQSQIYREKRQEDLSSDESFGSLRWVQGPKSLGHPPLLS